MNSRPSGAEKFCFPLCAAAWLGSAASGLAGPHHFQKWTEGEVVRVDTHSQLIAIRPAGDSAETTLKWDTHTRTFNEPNKQPNHSGVTESEADHLRVGERLRVLYQNQGKDLLARRIVRLPAPVHVERK